jgi:uncharacterized protein YjiK
MSRRVGRASKKRTRAPKKLVVVSVRETDVEELSAVTVAPGGRIFVADDEHGVGALTARGVQFPKAGAINGVEGIAAGDGGLYVVSENECRIYRIALRRDGGLGRATDLGKLPRVGRKKNKGWEGLAWLPAALNPEGRDRLVLVNEAKPCCVVLVAPGDFEDHVILELPRDLQDALEDLSDVAVEPVSGDLYLLSDDSSAIGVAALRASDAGLSLASRGVLPLPFRDAQSEGIAFDDEGRMLVASERGGTLHLLELR